MKLDAAAPQIPAAPRRALPAAARLPLVLLVALGTAALFHGCYWLLTHFLSSRL